MASPNTIDVIVRGHLAPALAALGFARTGRVFRRFADNGDAVVLDVQTSTASRREQAVFYVNVALVTVPWLQWTRRGSDDPAPPRPEEGNPAGRVFHTVPGYPPNQIWQATPETADACGRVLADATREAVAWYLSVLGDRAALLARLDAGEALPGTGSDPGLHLALLLDAGRFDDLRQKIAAERAYFPDSDAYDWLEARMAALG